MLTFFQDWRATLRRLSTKENRAPAETFGQAELGHGASARCLPAYSPFSALVRLVFPPFSPIDYTPPPFLAGWDLTPVQNGPARVWISRSSFRQGRKPLMWYDLLTLVILMYAMFRGAMKGIVWQLATIAALLMCFFFSGSLSAAVAPFIRVEPPLNQWIAMLILYLGFSFVSFGVARVAHEMIETMRIEALDRHLGAILGLVKGGMFSLFLTFFLVTLSHAARETIINSESGYVAAVVIDRLDPVIPGDLHALLEPYIRRLDAPEIERRAPRGAIRSRRPADDPRLARSPRRPSRRRRRPRPTASSVTASIA